MPSTIYHLENNTQGHSMHSYYSALSALWHDNKEDLPSLSTLQKWNWENDYVIDNSPNRIITIRKGQSWNTPEIRKYNIIDKLPPDIGAEHFE